MKVLNLAVKLLNILNEKGNVDVYIYYDGQEGESLLDENEIKFIEGHEEMPDRILLDLW